MAIATLLTPRHAYDYIFATGVLDISISRGLREYHHFATISIFVRAATKKPPPPRCAAANAGLRRRRR